MTVYEHNGEAMLRLHEANLRIGSAIAQAFRRMFSGTPVSVDDDLLSSPSFRQQEPDLAKESHIPGTYA